MQLLPFRIQKSIECQNSCVMKLDDSTLIFNILQIRGIFFHNWPFYYTDKIQNESLSLKMIGLIADWFYFVISLIFIFLEPIIVEAII